ncbi:MAG TPA: tetratricopeptide repeat protein [Blastocatellia bacterium]|nr:tetratricopeptide repeat protein [Blastocatellia bacterium]
MNKDRISCGAWAVVIWGSLIVLGSLPALGQPQERGLTVVGRARTESKATQKVELWALLIGVSRFQNGDQNVRGNQISNLKYAGDDAQAIYEFLRSDEGGAFPEDHIFLLKDEKATKAEVEKALAALRKTRPDDFFVTFIATHGVLAPQYDSKLGRTIEVPYFVLYDSDLSNMQNTALPMSAFQDAVKQIPAKQGLVLSDTCHSAAIVMAGRGAEVAKRANSDLVEKLKQADVSGIGYIWAADQTEVSLELDNLNQGQGQGQGVFTYALLEGLRGNADTDPVDGIVTFLELKNYVQKKVPELTGETPQHPGGNTTTIEANTIPLSIVPGSCKDPTQCGSLVIRAPDLDNVSVAIDGANSGTISSKREITRRVPTGDRRLSFTMNGVKREREARIEAGKSRFVEVNLSLSQSDDDAIVPTPESLVNVYFGEVKEPSKDAREAFLDGVDYFNKQKTEQAIEKFNDAIKKNGGSPYPDALVYRGRAEQSLGRKADAVASFQQALAVRKSDFETETLLAEAKFNLNLDRSEAESSLRSVIRRHPNWDYPHVVLGDVLFFKGDYIAAERELQKAKRINPKSPPARLILADVLTHQDSKQKREQAVKEARDALELFAIVSQKKVSASRSLKGLSISHLIFGGGRYRNDAAMAEAHHVLGKTLTRVVYFDDSIANPDAYLDEARTNLNEAQRLAQSLTDKSRLALVLETSALNYFLKGDLVRAIDDGEKALKLSASMPALKDFPNAHLTLASAYASNQKFAPAVDHMQKYIAASNLTTDEKKRYEEDLAHFIKMRDSNRQKK